MAAMAMAPVFTSRSGGMHEARSRTPSPTRGGRDDDIKNIKELVTKAMPHLSSYAPYDANDATPRNVFANGDATPKMFEDGIATPCDLNDYEDGLATPRDLNDYEDGLATPRYQYSDAEEEEGPSPSIMEKPLSQMTAGGGMRLVFCEQERGLPSLGRGWKTPDPEPLVYLPRCSVLEPCVEGDEKEAQAEVSIPQADDIVEEGDEEEEKEEAYTFVCEPCIAPAVSPAWDLPPGVPSRGSLGHPYNCGQGCKYFGKARGCKDGANCDHCHICEWKRGPRKPMINQTSAYKGYYYHRRQSRQYGAN